MSDSDIFETVCPYCDEIHHIIAPNRSVASYIFLNSIKPSLVYRQHMWKCSKCPCHTFSASDLQKILKEIMLYDKKNGEFLNPKPRTRSDTTSRRNHLAITPTFPDKNPCMTKYKMDKLISKILKLDPDSQIEAHFEIGGGSNKDDDHPDGIYHYHIYAHTTFSLVQQNNKILSNIMEKHRIDLKTLKGLPAICKWRKYIRKDLDKFQDKRLEFPSYKHNIDI